MSTLLRLVCALIPAIVALGVQPMPGMSQSNPIVLENRNAGSPTGQLYYSGRMISDDVKQQIQGYATLSSVNKGASIQFHITVNPPQRYGIEIYRLGYYSGLGSRLIMTSTGLSGRRQPDCPADVATGLVQCNWTPGFTLTVPLSWTTGIYRALLINEQGYESWIGFVVRDDSRSADFLYQQPVLTYAAYNNWPQSSSSGKSLYDYNSAGPQTALGTMRAVKVSLDRPRSDQFGLLNSNFSWEYNLVYWLEQQGYDVSYSTNLDTHRNGERLLEFKGFFSAGHDEYWTDHMFSLVERARNSGVHLAFWGANAAYWRVRLEASASGKPDRVIVCYKDVSLDPSKAPSDKTITFRSAGRPEQQLIGIQFIADNAALPNAPITLINTQHPVYNGSDISEGQVVTGLLGYEVDAHFPDYTRPVSTEYVLLSASVFTASNGVVKPTHSSLYRAPSGAWVFAAGTLGWSWALSRPGYTSPGLTKVTQNILELFAMKPRNQQVFLPITSQDEPKNTT
jgi:hypothetical protein